MLLVIRSGVDLQKALYSHCILVGNKLNFKLSGVMFRARQIVNLEVCKRL